MKPLVLIADDDAHIREIVRFALAREGYAVHEVADGAAALEAALRLIPALVVLDVMMPEMDGTEVCRRLRRSAPTVPIIFLSSRDDEIDRVLGLELGGDDYVTKPFSPRELVARVKAVLRRAELTSAPSEPASERVVLEHGLLRLDNERFTATWDDAPVTLTVTEFGMLRTMMRVPGKVFSRDELMRGAYKEQTVVSDRTIDSHVTRLRRKFEAIGAQPIETVHGVGYKCSSCDS